MNMSTWAIRKPVPTIALFLVLIIVGLVSFGKLPITQFPNIDVPFITIGVGQPGAAPSEIASQVVKPIESAVSDITGVKHISVNATDGYASFFIEFALETNSTKALNVVVDAVANIRSDLPENITEPRINRLDITGMPILTYAVSDNTLSIEELSYFVDNVIARELKTVSGVGKVSRIGGGDRVVQVDLDPAACSHLAWQLLM
ncbi:efflux RND transporter permease subunit [Ahrensia kielensis]|uniref:Efflux RND transporter permease subunit n=1 Tax=Ahrensia kielensis TaxID=76980 RepID=A0ABU9T1N9_9HYPH